MVFLFLNAHLQGTSRAWKLARSDAHPPDSGKNAFPVGFTTQAKQIVITRFMQRKTHYDIRNVIDINKVLSKWNWLNMRKLTLNIGTIRWNADICRTKNSHANFLLLRMIQTVNKFLMAPWFFYYFHQNPTGSDKQWMSRMFRQTSKYSTKFTIFYGA